jgi:KDO2-lipid IV(A) lauroyltransferase
MRATLRQRLEYAVFRVFVCLIECLPARASARWADLLATLIHYGLPGKLTRYPVARDNLRRALPQATEAELSQIVCRMWAHLFRTVVELVQAPRKLHLYSYRDVVTFIGLDQTNEALLSGRRVLILGGHFGSWEISTALFGLWGFRMGIIARAMDNPLLDDWFRRSREQSGHKLLLKRGGFDDTLEVLQAGGMIGLLADQDAGGRGLFVDFFGHPASTFKSIALLSLEYDAPIIVGGAIRLPDDFTRHRWARFEVRGETVIDPRAITACDPVREITQQFTTALEQLIRRAPEQYFWLHRRWKSEPVARRKAA